MTVRTKSVLEKAGYIPELDNINLRILTDETSIALLKLISNFKNIILNSMEKNEPSIIARYVIEVAKAYSTFYSNNKILTQDKKEQDARLYLTYMTKITLTNGLNLLGIEVPNKM